MSEYELIELPNKIRIVHKQISSTKIAHCALMLDVGSRDEKESEQGLAHFWEHMVFKGTKKRKAFHVINRLESLGGELNAYTTKEKICFYTSVLDNHLDKSIELLADITFNSIFPEVQIDKERQVILEEMAMYLDNPEDAIQDELDTLVFKGHQFGNNILGTEESVKRFKKIDFDNFLDKNIDTSRIVFSSTGNYSMKTLLRAVEKYLSPIPAKSNIQKRISIDRHVPSKVKEYKDLNQSHVGLGKRAYPIHSDNRIPFFVLNNLLGGQNMNSRLNLELREKHGLVYHVESNYQAYTDTGMFSVFYATEPNKMVKSFSLIEKVFQKMKEIPLGNKQLRSVKDQIKGQLAMSEESNQNYMLMMAKSILDYDRIDSLAFVFEKIESISANDIIALSREMLNFEEMSSLVYVPNE